MQCPFCGMENSDSARTCASCSRPAFALSQQKFRKAASSHNGYINSPNSPAAGSWVNLGLRSRAEKLSRGLHLTVPTTPPIGNPAHAPKGSASSRRQSAAQSRFQTPHATGNPDARKEPDFVSHAGINQTPPYPYPAYGGTGSQPPWPRSAQSRQTVSVSRNFFSQAALIVGVFALGAATGLGVTWWMKESAATMQPRSQQSSPEAVAHTNETGNKAPTPPVGRGASAIGASGMNPNELPYDGQAPGQAEEAPAATATTDMRELPYGGTSDRGSAAKAEAGQAATPPLPRLSKKAPVTATSTASGELPYEGTSGTKGTSRRGSDEAILRSTKSTDKARREVSAATEESGKSASAATQAQSDEKKAVKAPQRRASSQRIAKDKEIERIKQQADEELKKKTENKRLAAETQAKARGKEKKPAMHAANTSSPTIASESRRTLLARCEKASNFIRREHCKWQVCNGMWGKDGCPSYER